MFASLPISQREYSALLIEHGKRLRAPLFVERVAVQRLLQGEHAIAVDAVFAVRELIRVAAAFDDECLVEEADFITRGDAQPEIVVFANRQRLVERADALEQLAAHEHGRGADDATRQTERVNRAAGFLMNLFLIHAHAATNPNLVGVAKQEVRMRSEPFDLPAQLVFLPKVVRI